MTLQGACCRFATPPLHVRWKRPRQQASSAHAAASLPSMTGTEQAALDATSSPQANINWLSGKTEQDLFKSPDNQVGEQEYLSSLTCVRQN